MFSGIWLRCLGIIFGFLVFCLVFPGSGFFSGLFWLLIFFLPFPLSGSIFWKLNLVYISSPYYWDYLVSLWVFVSCFFRFWLPFRVSCLPWFLRVFYSPRYAESGCWRLLWLTLVLLWISRLLLFALPVLACYYVPDPAQFISAF